MRRSRGSSHPLARRAAVAALTVLTASGVGLLVAPMAFGQIVVPIAGSSQGASVNNAGSASANTGGNTAVGNTSDNTATGGGATSGLIAANVGLLNGPTNNSQGAAGVNTGPATAVGNSSDTAVGQSNDAGHQVRSFLGSQHQSAGVTNAGSASANTGGNNAVGNASTNQANGAQNVSGGLLGLNVGLGGPTNNSTGVANVNTGAANAVGNNASTQIGQASLRGGAVVIGPGGHVVPAGAVAGVGGAGVGAGPCPAGRFGSFQRADVTNRGEAEANTGNNTAVGNASTNTVNAPQTVSGGLLGVGITIGGPVNNSTGTAVINTGPANAVGNDSSTEISQFEGCPQVTTVVAGRHVVVPAAKVVPQHRPGALARTGLDTGDLGMIAGAALGMGTLLVASQRRRITARRAAAVPMAGFGFGMGSDDWDRVVR